MIETALYQHLQSQAVLDPFMATYNGQKAIFNQEAPADTDDLWGDGSQYGRLVFSVDLTGDPERILGGLLAVDISCDENQENQVPEVMEPIVRELIHGYFFSNGKFVVAAQWKNTNYFTEPTNEVIGCTIAFDLLAFPVLTTSTPDVIARINEWTSANFEGLHVINHDELPSTAWKPSGNDSAVYWRTVTEGPATWIPDTFQTIWRIANLKCHIFSQDISAATTVARDLVTGLYAAKRLLKPGETPIMVNRRNTQENGADPLRTGQVSVEATYAVIVHRKNSPAMNHINTTERST